MNASWQNAGIVTPTDPPSLAVMVHAGDHVVRGQNVHIPKDVHIPVEGCEQEHIKSESVIMLDELTDTWHLGTILKETVGPLEGARRPKSIVAESVKVYSENGTIYKEDDDYLLDHTWGGMSRVKTGAIGESEQVLVDYSIWLHRVDTLAANADGSVALIRGVSAKVCPQTPDAAPGQIALASIYVKYRTEAISDFEICPQPKDDVSWHDLIKVSGREHLSNTLNMLKNGERVTIVCWGDSVTEGSPSKPELNYVEVFHKRLRSEYPFTLINTINAGIGGSNTDSRRDGYEHEVLRFEPDLITVEFVNDCGGDRAHVLANFAEFVKKARAKNPKVEFIILTPHFMLDDWMGNFHAAVAAMREATEINNIALADTSHIWENLQQIGIPYETLLANYINHPYDLGHEFFAANLMELLKKEDSNHTSQPMAIQFDH